MPRKNFEVVALLDYSWKSVLFHMHDFSTMIQIFFFALGLFPKGCPVQKRTERQVWISVPKLGISAALFPKCFQR